MLRLTWTEKLSVLETVRAVLTVVIFEDFSSLLFRGPQAVPPQREASLPHTWRPLLT